MSASSPPGRLAFGPFVLDVASHRLTRGDRVVALGDRAMGVLVELVTHAGQVLTKDELIERVWPDVGISDEALAQAVHELRKALEDSSRAPLYVQTVHGRGYRFVARLQAVESSTLHPPTTGPKALRLAVAVPVLLGLVVAAAWLLLRRSPQRPAPQHIEEFVRLPGGAFKPAFSPDGRTVAVVSGDEAGRHAIVLVRPGAPGALRLTRGMDVRGPSPTFSADGNWVLFTSYRSDNQGQAIPDLWRVPVLGGRAEVLVESASAAHQDRSGRRLVFSRVGTGGTSVVVREADGREHVIGERGFWPRWSADGEWIAYTTSDPEGGNGDLFVVRPDGSERRRLTQGPWQFYGLDWTPQGDGVVFSAARDGPFQLWYVAKEGGAPVRLTLGAGEDTCPAVAPDGSQLLFVNGRMRSSVLVADELSGSFRKVGSGDEVLSVARHPASPALAVVWQHTGTEGNLSVLAEGSQREEVVAGIAALHARWSADGQSLVAAGWRDPKGTRQIVRVGWPSGAVSTLVSDCPCEWPDLHGDTLAFLRHGGDTTALVVRDLAGSGERVLVERAEISAPRLSPDGRRVAWSGFLRPTDADSTGIWVMPVDASDAPRRLVADGAWPSWDGPEHLLFVRGAAGDALWRVPVTTGDPERVRALELAFPISAFDAAGRRLAVALHVDTPAVFVLHGQRLPP